MFVQKGALGPWAGDDSGNTVKVKEVGDGLYAVDWPRAMFASEDAEWVMVVVKSSTSAFVPVRIQYGITDRRPFGGRPRDFREPSR